MENNTDNNLENKMDNKIEDKIENIVNDTLIFKKRNRNFSINLIIILASILFVLGLMLFSPFLNHILEGNKKTILCYIIGIGLVFVLIYTIIFRFVKIDVIEAHYLLISGTKKEKKFYDTYQGDANIVTINGKKKYNLSNKGIMFNIFANISEIYAIICIAFLIVSSTFCFLLFPATVHGDCMEPLLYGQKITYEGDKIIALRTGGFKLGDVIVFSYDYDIQQVGNVNDGELLVKRCIAGPGQKFECINGKIYIDGELLAEDYCVKKYENSQSYDINKIIKYNTNCANIPYNNDNIIPEGYYVLLGDNRWVANDSHCFGLVREDQICGRVALYKGVDGWKTIKKVK